jgi:N-acetylmuramoyl-L-alanine amidase
MSDGRASGGCALQLADSPLAGAIVPAANAEPRRDGLTPQLLILHYTGMSSARKAVAWLASAESRVSCHYVVDEAGFISQLVPERLRAWHAGVSVWAGETDINSASIGIEIHNPGHEHGYPAFPLAQMRSVAGLCADICQRNGIAARHVLAHSDIAPHRKIDPGEGFDWSFLFKAGVGHWVPPVPLDGDDAGFEPGYAGPAVAEAQAALAAYGYGVPLSGTLDAETVSVLRAFQRHFRPARVDGRLDGSTIDTLRRVVSGLAVA